MARNISGTTNNELRLRDNMSGSEIVLYYRTPTTGERNGYQNMAIQRRRNKVVMNQANARLEYGLKILTGFRSGDFVRNVGGKAVGFSSNPAADDYLPSWKDELKQGADDLIMLLAAHVFDGSAEIDMPEDDDDGGIEEDDADPNLPPTSPQ